MVIQHNIPAENSGRMQRIVSGKLSGLSEKLSSGYRINRGADDAAGLAISEKMRFQVRGLDRGSANIEEGVGYCQVADGALGEMHDMLQRMNELCIQAANGTLSNTDRGYIDDEIQLLKAETDRICRTTKFNEEYIFRCDDVIPEVPHDVYDLSFSGRPKDLFIYNESYDPANLYAGVVFRGKRYTWDEISPGMYDKTTGEFHEGRYSIRADDGTLLTLVCVDGATLPQVSREFRTSADGKGIYVNDDFVSWDSVNVTGDKYTFDYHGMTISYTKDAGDTFEDMMLKMTGTVWESTYETPVVSKALDAQFSFSTYKFMNQGANTRIGEYLKKGTNTKYILHAVDGNKGGTIPTFENGVWVNKPFDGIWLEGTNYDWSRTNQPLFSMTWKELGFDCTTHTNLNGDYCDWGNNSTDIWVGGIKDDPKPTYPPDSVSPGYVHPTTGSITIGNQYFATYDPYNEFRFVNTGDNGELTRFIFSVINEISKEDAVNALNNIGISYGAITTENEGRLDNVSPKMSGTRVSVVLSLGDEYDLGRDYENEPASYELKEGEQLQYQNGSFSISYKYADDRRKPGQSKTYTMSSSQVDNLVQTSEAWLIRNCSGNVTKSLPISLSLGSGSGTMTINCNYAVSGISVDAVRKDDGAYVRNSSGGYELYDPNNWQHNQPGTQRYDVSVSAPGGSLENYMKNTVFPDIADNTEVSLWTKDYPKGTLAADENPNSAMVTRWQTPFQHDHPIALKEPEEKPEYLRIQCSSNTIDNIYIQKQKLSVYRLGLLNVGTLSEMQATGCIDMVGGALSKVSSVRSLFGAYQNRLERAYAINRNTHENTQGAESTIRDADMAEEIVKFSNCSILQQSANSMLAQANQANRGVLTLLQ